MTEKQLDELMAMFAAVVVIQGQIIRELDAEGLLSKQRLTEKFEALSAASSKPQLRAMLGQLVEALKADEATALRAMH